MIGPKGILKGASSPLKRFLGEGPFLRKKGPSGAPAAKGGEGYNRASQSAELPCTAKDLRSKCLRVHYRRFAVLAGPASQVPHN